MTERYGNVRVTHIKAAFQAHREAIQMGDLERAWETWGRCEEWLGWAEAEAVKAGKKDGAWLPITNTETGETRMYWAGTFDPNDDGVSEFLWAEGQNCCDSNRSLFFALVKGEGTIVGYEPGCDEGRFHVAAAYCANGAVVEIDGPTSEGDGA